MVILVIPTFAHAPPSLQGHEVGRMTMVSMIDRNRRSTATAVTGTNLPGAALDRDGPPPSGSRPPYWYACNSTSNSKIV